MIRKTLLILALFSWSDLLHPNAKGYAKWERVLRPAFESLGLLEEQ